MNNKFLDILIVLTCALFVNWASAYASEAKPLTANELKDVQGLSVLCEAGDVESCSDLAVAYGQKHDQQKVIEAYKNGCRQWSVTPDNKKEGAEHACINLFNVYFESGRSNNNKAYLRQALGIAQFGCKNFATENRTNACDRAEMARQTLATNESYDAEMASTFGQGRQQLQAAKYDACTQSCGALKAACNSAATPACYQAAACFCQCTGNVQCAAEDSAKASH